MAAAIHLLHAEKSPSDDDEPEWGAPPDQTAGPHTTTKRWSKNIDLSNGPMPLIQMLQMPGA